MNTASGFFRKFITSLLLHGITLGGVACLWTRQPVAAIPVFQTGEFSVELGAALPATPAVVVASPSPPAPEPPTADIAKDPEEPLEIEEVPEEEPDEMQIATETPRVPGPPPPPTPAMLPATTPSRSDHQGQPDPAPVSGAANPGLAGTPRLGSTIHPIYPPGARLRGEEGAVTVSVFVTSSGKARTVKVVRSSGFPALDQSALNAVRRARFIPARKGHTAVESQTMLTFRFTLVD